jgi:uncharacterized membrane protein YccF (DUF307 family)
LALLKLLAEINPIIDRFKLASIAPWPIGKAIVPP